MARNQQSIFGQESSSLGIGGGTGGGRGHTRADVDAMQQGQLLYRLTGESDFRDADVFYVTSFTTLNDSGVTGVAIIGYDVDSGTITVAISASGLEPNQVHIQHIHGFPDGTNATTPTTALDDDGDGFVELAEGLATYGPILLDLSINHEDGTGNDNGHSHEGGLSGFPTAPDGNIWFVETYQLPAGSLPAEPTLDLREIVIHGMSVNATDGVGTAGEVDGTAGFKLVLPVASGELVEVASAKELRYFIRDNDFDDAAAANVDGPFGGSMARFDAASAMGGVDLFG